MVRRVIDSCHEAILTRLDHFCGIYGALSAGRRASESPAFRFSLHLYFTLYGTGENTKCPHAYFVCKIENPPLLSFHAWLSYGKLLDKIFQFSFPYKKQPWKFHFPILTWKITFPQIIFYFPSMYFCS